MKDLRLLVINGEKEFRAKFKRLLAKSDFKIEFCDSLEGLTLEFLDGRTPPDVVICPVSECDLIQQRIEELFPRSRNIQYIQTFAREKWEGVLENFNKENRDCLPIPFTRATLWLAIYRAVERRDLIARNLRSRKRLQHAVRDLEENLSILQADQIAGRQVQQALLPRSPVHPGPYYAALKVLPSLYLSGDFVNYQSALDRYLLFYLTDVSGHGAASAFVTVMVKQMMNRIVSKHVRTADVDALNQAPKGFLNRINKLLIESQMEKHLAMFAGSLDMQHNRLRFSVGAQIPHPILIVDGQASYLKSKGKPVGIFPNAEWKVEEIPLPKKFVLIAFSDGILEVLPQKSLKKKEQFLLDALAECEGDIETVLPLLGLKDTSSLPDDIAILMIARGHEERA